MKKIVRPHKARKPSAFTDVLSFARGKDQILKSPTRMQKRKKNQLDEFDTGKDDYSQLYQRELDVPIKTSNNKYNLTPRQLAGISNEYGSVVFDPKQYIKDFEMLGPSIFDQDYINQANEYLDNDGFFEMSPLPEITVTPDYNLMRKAQQIIPNKPLRTALYRLAENWNKDHSSNYGVGRLLDLYQYAGSPSVKDVNTGIYSIFPSKFPDGSNRPFFTPGTNTMHLNRDENTPYKYGSSYDYSDFIAELAHPYHIKVSGLSPSEIVWKAIVRGNPDKKINGKTAYQRRGDLEYQTHSIIEPEMIDYIDSEESLNNFNKRLSKKIKTDSKYRKGGVL